MPTEIMPAETAPISRQAQSGKAVPPSSTGFLNAHSLKSAEINFGVWQTFVPMALHTACSRSERMTISHFRTVLGRLYARRKVLAGAGPSDSGRASLHLWA